MKEKIKKFLFPFFKERHKFLLEKWWFRLIIVIYIIAFIIAPFMFFAFYMYSASGSCYDSLYLYYGDTTFNVRLAECSRMAREAWTPGIGFAVIGTLILHYLIQIIFFKIVINFIVLGSKK